jgi:hypothetical protein
MTTTDNDPAPRRKRGRPKKSEIAAKAKGGRNKVGRPKGEAGIINEYRARMLASPKSNLVLESIYDAALNDDHKNQAAAWKLLMDRILPLSYFEKKNSDGQRGGIKIEITGVPGVSVGESAEAVDGEWSDVTDSGD